MKHPQSFGWIIYYSKLIELTYNNKHSWRKCANILNNVRANLREWSFVDKRNQFNAAEAYAKQAIRDTILPPDVKAALMQGMFAEFKFNF